MSLIDGLRGFVAPELVVLIALVDSLEVAKTSEVGIVEIITPVLMERVPSAVRP